MCYNYAQQGLLHGRTTNMPIATKEFTLKSLSYTDITDELIPTGLTGDATKDIKRSISNESSTYSVYLVDFEQEYDTGTSSYKAITPQELDDMGALFGKELKAGQGMVFDFSYTENQGTRPRLYAKTHDTVQGVRISSDRL